METELEQPISPASGPRKRCWILVALFTVFAVVMIVFIALEVHMPVPALPTPTPEIRNATFQVVSYALPAHASVHRKGYSKNAHVQLSHEVQQRLNVTDCWLCSHLPQTAASGLLTYSEPLPESTTALALFWATFYQNTPAAVMLNIDVLMPRKLFAQELANTIDECGEIIGKLVKMALVDYAKMTLLKQVQFCTDLLKEGARAVIPFKELIKPQKDKIPELKKMCQHAIYDNTVCPAPLHTHIMKPPLLCFEKEGGQFMGAATHCPQTVLITHNFPLYAGPSLYFVCGENAYLWLPDIWGGICYLSLLLPDILPVQTLDLHLLDHKVSSLADLVRERRSFTAKDFFKGLFPMYGITENSRAIHSLALLLEQTVNNTVTALQSLSIEVRALRLVALQNRLGLDLLFAKQGKLCKVIGFSCCMYVPSSSQTVQASIHKLHAVALGAEEVEESMGPKWSTTSWATSTWSSWGWRILICIFGIAAGLAFCCTCIHCIPALCSTFAKLSTSPSTSTSAQLLPMRVLRTHPDNKTGSRSAYVDGYGHLPLVLRCHPRTDLQHLYMKKATPLAITDGTPVQTPGGRLLLYVLRKDVYASPEK